MNSHMRCVVAFLVAFATLFVEPASAQATERVSVATVGTQGNDYSEGPAVSADGRFVVFHGMASNLVAGDSNLDEDVFLRDRTNGTTELISVSTTGTSGDHASSYDSIPSISADGRFVAFESYASNLVVADSNGHTDIFVRDRQSGTTVLVSVASNGAQGNGDSHDPSISADGRFVAFWSLAGNLVPGGMSRDIYLHDRQTGATTRASVATGGAPGNANSEAPQISGDGRFVAFESLASNLVGGDTNNASDIFVRDLLTGVTTCVSVDASGTPGNGFSHAVSISSDGRFVAFFSQATNLVGGDTNGFQDVFVRDRWSGTTALASVSTGGTQANSASYDPWISADGRFVAFGSGASNLVPGTSSWGDIFVRDLEASMTTRVSINSSGSQAGNASSGQACVSADGRYIAFHSYATNLVTGDTNGIDDVFVRERGTAMPTPYCTAGTTSNNCVALISGTGTPSASAGSGFSIDVIHVEGQQSGLIFYGLSGHVTVPWGTGTSYMCVKSPLERTPVQNSGGTLGACDGVLSIDWNSYIATHPSALGNPFLGGEEACAQAWFRDPPSPKTTSLSSALVFTVYP